MGVFLELENPLLGLIDQWVVVLIPAREAILTPQTRILFDSCGAAIPATRRERFESGAHIEEFLIYRFLPHAVKFPVQRNEHLFNVLLGALHRRQAACILRGQRLSAGLE
jgi:hypothetical protein